MKKTFVIVADIVAYNEKEPSPHYLAVDQDSGGYPYWSGSLHHHTSFNSKKEALAAMEETKNDKYFAGKNFSDIRVCEICLIRVS